MTSRLFNKIFAPYMELLVCMRDEDGNAMPSSEVMKEIFEAAFRVNRSERKTRAPALCRSRLGASAASTVFAGIKTVMWSSALCLRRRGPECAARGCAACEAECEAFRAPNRRRADGMRGVPRAAVQPAQRGVENGVANVEVEHGSQGCYRYVK